MSNLRLSFPTLVSVWGAADLNISHSRLNIEFPEPTQRTQPGQKAVLASPGNHKPGQTPQSHPKWPLGDVKRSGTIAPSGDGVFSGAGSEKATVVHPLGLDEFELPPKMGSDERKH
jgi:hypothetical protein